MTSAKPEAMDPAPAAPAAAPKSAGSGASKLLGKPWFWGLVVALLALVPLTRALMGRSTGPDLKLALPAFQLTSERGAAFGSKDLKGKVWVADFVFTTCPTVCPKLTARMAEIQRKSAHLGDDFHIVTFTVDPENDTPEVLAAYAKSYAADPKRWTFLTGSLADIESTVVKGFKIAMGRQETSPGSGLFSIFHGERLVLVDRDANIRGYYEANDEGIAKLLVEAETLAR